MRRSINGLTRGAGPASAVLLCLSLPTFMPPEFPAGSAYNAYAQAPAKVRNVVVDFVPEPGCPIGPTSMRCELDCDAFDAPMDARVYLDYKNNSDRAVSAVKFRLRFVDAEQKDRGTFHVLGPAAAPQGVGGVKAKRDITLHPSIVGLKVRVLQVKYGDGSDWSSVKMQELVNPSAPGGPAASTGGSPSLPSAVNSAPMVDEAADISPRSNAPMPSSTYGAAPPAAAAPYTTGVRGKTYEVAPPGATESYAHQFSSLGAGGSPQSLPPGPAQAPFQGAASTVPQAATPATNLGPAPVAPGTAAAPQAPAVPFYTPPPMPKIGTSPVFNPLTEPDASGAAPATSVPAISNSPVKDLPAQAQIPTQIPAQIPTQIPAQTTKPASASANVFATSPMAASDSAKTVVQAAQSAGNAFASGAPGAMYAPAINAAKSGVAPAAVASPNYIPAAIPAAPPAVIPAASPAATAGATAAVSTMSGAGTNPNTSLGTAPVSTGNSSNKGVEPINTPWHP